MNERILAALLIGLVAGFAGGFLAATVTGDRGTDATVLAEIRRDFREVLQTQKEIQHQPERPPSEGRPASGAGKVESPVVPGITASIEKMSESLNDLGGKVDEIRAALLTERLDRIPPDLRVLKQVDRVADLAATLAADQEAARSRIFGWSYAQMYKEYGEPDWVDSRGDSNGIRWIYFIGDQEPGQSQRGMQIFFYDGMATSVQGYGR